MATAFKTGNLPRKITFARAQRGVGTESRDRPSQSAVSCSLRPFVRYCEEHGDKIKLANEGRICDSSGFADKAGRENCGSQRSSSQGEKSKEKKAD